MRAQTRSRSRSPRVAVLAAAALVLVLGTGCVSISRPAAPAGNRLVFGLGPTASGARASRLGRETDLGMYTTWYNGPGDLGWLTQWWDDEVPSAYRAGKAMHLVVWTGDAEGPVATPYGTGCGRRYPLSDRFVDDMAQLANAFKGSAGGPPLYVTLFTEFQTYPCTDNQWNPNPQTNVYLRALKDRYLLARKVFRLLAPNAKVSLSWGGWQADWDAPATGGGRSMIPHFTDVMQSSDFQSFQAMGSTGNVSSIKAMTRILGQHGPVMLSHYKPDNGSQATFNADVAALFTDATMAGLKRDGLFAFSFMDTVNMAGEGPYQAVKRAVTTYGTDP